MNKYKENLKIFLILCLLLSVFVLPFEALASPEIKAIRKILIVSEGQIEQGVEMSKTLNVAEVAEGIPPRLKDKVTEDMLPYVYEEMIYKDDTTLLDMAEELRKAIEENGADIAEYYPIINESIEAGDLVVVADKEKLNSEADYLLEKSGQIYDPKLLGVVSSESAMTIGRGATVEPEQILRPVALTGRVPVKVNLENGPIAIGDYLTSSNVPGVAMKATGRGKVVGMALESLGEYKINPETGYGMVMMFIDIGWYNGSSATSTDSLFSGGFFEGLGNIVSAAVDAITGIPKMIVNGILEVKNNVVAHGFFQGIFRVSKTLVLGRTITIENAVTAENTQLGVASEDDESLSFVTYSIVSPRKEIMVSGSGRLLMGEDGKVEAKIAFHPYFSAILSEEQPVRVIVTPTTYMNGHLYVLEKSIYGFTIKEINSQDEGAEFDWIVTARLTDPERAQEVLEETETIATQEPAEDVAVCQNGENKPCGTEVGVCQIGVQICEQGVWGECIGAVMPAEELCDDVDNDCDGEIDEDGVCDSITTDEPPLDDTVPIDTATSTEPTATSTEPIIPDSEEGDTTTTTDETSTSTEPIIEEPEESTEATSTESATSTDS